MHLRQWIQSIIIVVMGVDSVTRGAGVGMQKAMKSVLKKNNLEGFVGLKKKRQDKLVLQVIKKIEPDKVISQKQRNDMAKRCKKTGKKWTDRYI